MEKETEMRREVFTYTYSAKQQEEIDNIRKKYLPEEENKMEQLRRLDQSATKRGTVISVAVGVFGALLLGVGMCCTMVWMGVWFFPGVAAGLLGIACIAAAYPVYSRITRKERKRLAPQILKLTEELLDPQHEAARKNP